MFRLIKNLLANHVYLEEKCKAIATPAARTFEQWLLTHTTVETSPSQNPVLL